MKKYSSTIPLKEMSNTRKISFPSIQFRYGFTLVEVSLAIFVLSIVLSISVLSVASAFNLQTESDRLLMAARLAQEKLTKLKNDPDLDVTDLTEEISDIDSVYNGYIYTVRVREEEVNLANIAEAGATGVALDELLPSVATNKKEEENELFADNNLVSLGSIRIWRITVSVKYPRGRKRDVYGNYNVETIRKSSGSRIFQR